jgi:flagellar hook-basal body complex protein FliE
MSELESAASDAAPETAVETQATAPQIETATPQSEAPSKSTREALERAFSKVDGQPRDEVGKWTKEQADAKANKAIADAKEALGTPAAPGAAVVPEGQPAATAAPSVEPPARLSPEAKAAWAATPPAVQADINRAFTEMTKGIEQYQQRFAPLKEFDDMARAGGTTLDTALRNYVGIENLLRADPVKGFVALSQNMGLDPVQVGQALLGQPSQGGSAPNEAALLNRIAQLEQQITGVSQTFQQRETEAKVEAFAAANPRFDELSEIMTEMLRTGFAKDLADAYAKADRLQPAPAPAAPQVAPARPQTPAKPSLQITGSPNTGSDPATRPHAGSPRDAVRNALSQVGL